MNVSPVGSASTNGALKDVAAAACSEERAADDGAAFFREPLQHLRRSAVEGLRRPRKVDGIERESRRKELRQHDPLRACGDGFPYQTLGRFEVRADVGELRMELNRSHANRSGRSVQECSSSGGGDGLEERTA